MLHSPKASSFSPICMGELNLEKLNMDEHALCVLLESLRFLRNLKKMSCTAGVNTTASITHQTLEQLSLDGISLTPAAATAIGRSVPEMASLTGVDGSIVQDEEMELWFGRYL